MSPPAAVSRCSCQGGNTPYLDHIAGVLRGIHEGSAYAAAMFAMLDDSGLIQPVTLDVQVAPHHRVSVSGLHGIDRERLATLDSARLAELNRAGYLEGAYLMLASLHNMRRLIAEKRRLRAQDGAATGQELTGAREPAAAGSGRRRSCRAAAGCPGGGG